MNVLFTGLVIPLVAYFLGVMIGRRSVFKQLEAYYEGEPSYDTVDADSIQHVGYTQEQMGYDK